MISPNSRQQSGFADLHPVLWIAAIAVIVFAVAGTAKMMGWIGNPTSDTPVTVSAVGQSVPATNNSSSSPASLASASTPTQAKSVTRTAPPAEKAQAPAQVASRTAPIPAQRTAQTCANCGTVESVNAIEIKGQGTGLGAVGGAAVGGVLGHQVGEGSGKDVATVAGAILGGLAGNEVERRARTETEYRIAVRMDDGTRQVLTAANPPAWRTGDRVRIQNGSLVRDTQRSESRTF